MGWEGKMETKIWWSRYDGLWRLNIGSGLSASVVFIPDDDAKNFARAVLSEDGEHPDREAIEGAAS